MYIWNGRIRQAFWQYTYRRIVFYTNAARIMTNITAIKLFEDRKVRSVWNAEIEKWYISIVDVVGVLTDSPNPRKYWSVLKTRQKKEGGELATYCSQLKMQSSDGKFYKTDVADVEQLFRLIRSIPSPKAEPFKLLFLCRNKSSG